MKYQLNKNKHEEDLTEMCEWAENIDAQWREPQVVPAGKGNPPCSQETRPPSADVIQEKDDGIIAAHSPKKEVQSIVAVTKASIIRKDVKNKIESTIS